MSGPTVVVTDSTVGPAGARPPGADVLVVALDVVVDGVARPETGLHTDELVRLLRAGVRVTTSRPSPEAFAAAYALAFGAGADAVVSVHLSGELSGTVDAARSAAGDTGRVEVVDSRSAAAGLVSAVLTAASAAARGEDPRACGDLARAAGEASRLWLAPASDGHLERGGRGPGPAPATPAGLTAHRLLALEGGRLVSAGRVRTPGAVLTRLVDLAAGALSGTAGTCEVVVHHLDAARRALELAELLRARTGADVSVTGLGAVLGSHVGPGAVGVAVVPSPA